MRKWDAYTDGLSGGDQTVRRKPKLEENAGGMAETDANWVRALGQQNPNCESKGVDEQTKMIEKSCPSYDMSMGIP